MIRSKYRWVLPTPDTGLAERLAAEHGVGKLASGVLAGRGWEPGAETAAFLDPSVDGLLDPYLMKGMAEAVERIGRAARDGERIRVYGDYDADGVTSTALMIRLLTELGANFDTYIPHRGKEGYGLNIGAIDRAANEGVRLLVTVDNGISAAEQIAHATGLGIDVVVTDHHEPPDALPMTAVALVNPKRKDCPYPFKGLCGAGVVFKLAHAMLGRPVLEYADLAAIGTIADLMPLVGENRIIARLGLESLRRRPVPGIRALAKVAGINVEELSSGRIGFSLAPRLNAGGRLESADGAVKLLTAASEEEAEIYAAELDRLNAERQDLVERTVDEAEGLWQAILTENPDRDRRVIVLAREGWNAGIAGLVASKFVERYYRPAFVLAIDPETGLAKGSGRSIDGFDLYAALTECAELMEHFGGHQAAAGLTMHRDRIGKLADGLDRIARERLSEEDWIPRKKADLVIGLKDVSLEEIDRVSGLEPFGNGNPTPRVVLRGAVVRESRTMGKEGKHLRVTLEQEGRTLEAVAFGMGAEREKFAPGMVADLLGELTVNEWNGNRKPQLMLQDYRSDRLILDDRRNERETWGFLEKLLEEGTEALAVVCASREAYREAANRFAAFGAAVGGYAWTDADSEGPEDDGSGTASDKATIAGRETAAGSASEGKASGLPGFGSAGSLRHLVLVGLPGSEPEIRTLERWLSPDFGLERVTVLNDPFVSRDSSVAETGAFPDRKQFGEIYALCRKRGSWLDAPDGFVRDSAQATNWPLATVRMMHEVFIELGFVSADGSMRKVVSDPPRRELAESSKYRKAREQARLRGFARQSAEELRKWMEDCHAKPAGPI